MYLLRKDLRKKKSSAVDHWMGVDSAQKAKFFCRSTRSMKNNLLWSGTSATNIMTYAANCANVSDAVADPLVGSAQASQAEGKSIAPEESNG